MSTSVREISASVLGTAIASVIANLTEKDCSVLISEINFLPNGLTSGESFSFSASVSCKLKETGEKPPF